jgi:hypothetical protein
MEIINQSEQKQTKQKKSTKAKPKGLAKAENYDTEQNIEINVESNVESNVEANVKANVEANVKANVEKINIEAEDEAYQNKMNDIFSALSEDNEETVESNIDYVDNDDNDEEIKNKLLDHQNNIIESFKYINSNPIKKLPLDKPFFDKYSKNFIQMKKMGTTHENDFESFTIKEKSDYLKKDDKKKKSIKKSIPMESRSINIPKAVYPQVLEFLKLEENTLVSRSELIQGINLFVTKEKKKEIDNNPIYVSGDNRRFNLVGDLAILFDFVKDIMIERGDLSDKSDFPENISYQEIMKYMKYMFVVTK